MNRTEHCTQQIIKLIKEDKMAEVFNLLMDMNYHITNETNSVEEAYKITRHWSNVMWTGSGDLTSKDKKWGEGRTPEMTQFFKSFMSYNYALNKESWDNFEFYTENYKKNKPNTDR
ncbi:MAG: hypothetical protein ACPG2Y_00095 [Acholeplasmataceae bacterium]